MRTQPTNKRGVISVDIDEVALLRVLERCDLHVSELHCRSREGKHHLQRLLLKAASRTLK